MTSDVFQDILNYILDVVSGEVAQTNVRAGSHAFEAKLENTRLGEITLGLTSRKSTSTHADMVAATNRLYVRGFNKGIMMAHGEITIALLSGMQAHWGAAEW